MRTFSKKVNEEQQDKLSFDLEINIKKEYRNITRLKGRMVPVVTWKVNLYINGNKLDEDEVFVEDEFFTSLLCPGKYPMFTCTCGIFGCGGYYVEVIHGIESLFWLTEQNPFSDRSIKTPNKFSFSWSQIMNFSEELIQKLEELKSIMASNGLEFRYDVERYKGIIEKINGVE
ncbi:hypothetical protein AMQ84_16240 [Paenibacillus riograndensis]|uniref:Uncharacterized protein n=1 Tax=Paenibacillus riograndensis TaxID=483937 RepID=A0A132TXN7_9BACL|nr:hypothetical protein [Paenibacillus riograndensis]KWX75903.1 hypothetical protein AMQ84_16240 [Paenibacillus riograndensis]KWX87677.1 hypothetical protein AMQ83_11660 [Paenibacillus riograndensis]